MTWPQRRAPHRVLLVGEDFGRSETRYHSDRYALTGQSGRRIASLAGLGFPLGYARTFDRTNVVELPDDWSDRLAVVAGASRVVAAAEEHERVIVLGRRAAAALGLLDAELLEWKSWRYEANRPMVEPVQVARAPHPSGRNRWWNSPMNVQQAERFFKEAVEWAKS